MGLATIDLHSQKERNEIHKSPKFGVNQRFKNVKIYKEMYGIRTPCRTASGLPYISL